MMEWDDAFGTILEHCLSLKPGDEELVVVFDESSQRYIPPLCSAALQRALTPTLIYVPIDEQRALVEETSGEENVLLPAPLRGALAQASGVLSIPGSDAQTHGFRRSLVQHTRSAECRLAHLPGLDDEILLTLARSPFREVQEACELVAWALGEAQRVTIVTRDDAGREHRLEIALSGWDDEPMMSSGVIAPGSWGNVPPGETFCCPDSRSVNGTIVIDGSVPGARLSAQQGIPLTFKEGVLTGWGARESPARDFLQAQREAAQKRGDRHWAAFAELGFGLNPAITELTGNALFDEKAAGTVHVAIGDNTAFGYHIKAGVHADMVTRRPTVLFDGMPGIVDGAPNPDGAVPVVANGVLNLDLLRAARDRYVPTETALPEGATVFLRQAKVVCENGLFKRRLFRNQRVGHVRVANEVLSRALALLVERMRDGEEIAVDELVAEHPLCNGFEARALLNILFHYRAIGIASL